MIPSRLITTWIHDNRNPYTDLHRAIFAKCLASWKRLMPFWEVRVVTSENLFEFGHDDWCQARMDEGNFIGASSWARYFWLQQLGGVYVDMDVEAVQAFDRMLSQRFVVGRQKDGFINTAVIGSEPGHPLLAQLLTEMKKCEPKNPQFGNECGPRLMTRLLKTVPGDVIVAPPEVFYPYHWNEPYTPACQTSATLAVHHWASTWWPPKPELMAR